ncbi:hypothetical protein EUU23_12245 [Sphingorhabdus sp. IMCC26285]|uniref:Lipopolysaccharide biosynthesis protein n=1 Tax=Sphingorhabdus profundilacus TaxID=2509718 RepID=A0A6I4M2G0_9SPHN|nr:hypothetical protein [Sphingorhabdus profundilacus]
MITPAHQRSVVRDLLTVMSGTAGAQALGLLILPVLARAFAPEAFGVFQLYLSLLVFCTVGIALRIELTLVSSSEEDLPHLIASLAILVIVVGIAVSGFLMLLTGLGFGPEIPIWLFGLGLIGNGFMLIASYMLIREQDFNRLAFLKFGQVGIYAVVALAMAAINPSIIGIILADVAGRIAAAAYGIITLRSKAAMGDTAATIRGLIPFVRRHRDLVTVSLPGALANSAGAMLTPFMIFHVFGAAAAGQFSLVDRAIGVPVAMIVGAGSQVFLGRITVHLRAQDYHAALAILLRIVIMSAVVAGAGAVILQLFLPYSFHLIFGPGWEPAILIAGVMIFGYAAAFVTGIVNQTLVAMREFRLQSIWDVGWSVAMGGAWIAVVAFGLDLYTAVAMHASIVAILGFVFVFMCIAKLRSATTLAERSGT